MSTPPLDLTPTQCAALAELAAHGALRRCPGPCYRAATPLAQIHSTRAAHALVRTGLAEWSDGESELRITTAGLSIAIGTGPRVAHGRVRAVRASSRQRSAS